MGFSYARLGGDGLVLSWQAALTCSSFGCACGGVASGRGLPEAAGGFFLHLNSVLALFLFCSFFSAFFLSVCPPPLPPCPPFPIFLDPFFRAEFADFFIEPCARRYFIVLVTSSTGFYWVLETAWIGGGAGMEVFFFGSDR